MNEENRRLHQTTEQQNLLISKLNAESESNHNKIMSFNKLSNEKLDLQKKLLQKEHENKILACDIRNLKNRPPKVVTKTVDIIKEKEKCQDCPVERLKEEKASLKFKNYDLSSELDNIKGNNKLLTIFGAIATIFSIYRNDSVTAELKPIFNWFVSIYEEYEHLAEVSILSASVIENNVLKFLAGFGIAILCGLLGAVLVGLVAYGINKYIAPFIENHFDSITNLVLIISLSVVLFVGGELKESLPPMLSNMNIFLLWLILFSVFFIGKCIKEKY